MPAQVNQEDCTGCGDCVTTCPVDGILVLEDEKVTNAKPDECIECNACIDTCSHNAMAMVG
jgi:NAD-dependent dihydropyrimidine dehydrogenase PreA subunit